MSFLNIKLLQAKRFNMVEFKRKLYKRGSSFETTIPMPILFAIDKNKKHNIIFKLDAKTNKWYIELEAAK